MICWSDPWYLQGGHQDRARLFTVVHGGRTNDNEHKVKQERFKLVIRRNCYPTRTGRQGSRLP